MTGVDEQPDQTPRIKELEMFLEQMHEALRSKKIQDFDTDWRVAEQVMPQSLECLHDKDSAEISGLYRKIHLSDVLSAARELINLYWKHLPKRESNSEWQPMHTMPFKVFCLCRNASGRMAVLNRPWPHLALGVWERINDGWQGAMADFQPVEWRHLSRATTHLESQPR